MGIKRTGIQQETEKKQLTKAGRFLLPFIQENNNPVSWTFLMTELYHDHQLKRQKNGK